VLAQATVDLLERWQVVLDAGQGVVVERNGGHPDSVTLPADIRTHHRTNLGQVGLSDPENDAASFRLG
jgi:hypothetical protein